MDDKENLDMFWKLFIFVVFVVAMFMF